MTVVLASSKLEVKLKAFYQILYVVLVLNLVVFYDNLLNVNNLNAIFTHCSIGPYVILMKVIKPNNISFVF